MSPTGLPTNTLYLPLIVSSASPNERPDDGQTVLIVQGVNDYGADLDGDGYFDQLVIEIEVKAPQPGVYWIQGELGVDHQAPTLVGTGGLIAATVVRADLADGTQRVQLVFDGLQISASKVDGPYTLKYLSITDVDNPTPEDFANRALDHWKSLYTTAAYQVHDFQNRGAALSGEITERGLDADGDGLYESLILNIGLNIFTPGTYTVQGDLYDSQERFVTRATWSGTGPTASIQFDRLPGTVGPYTLRNVYLLNADGEIIDSLSKAYTTQQVIKAEGGTRIVDQAALGEIEAHAILPGTYSDSGQDLDGDGLYDLLVIDVQVEVEEASQYRLEGWLEKDGSLISWASGDPASLAAGTHSLSLAFSGPAIHAHNTDGPFTLTALKLLKGHGYEVLDEVDVAYTTSAYANDQFESLPYLPANHVALFEDHLENGEGNWTADWPWALTTAQFHSPIHAWTDSPGGNYANDGEMSLTTVPINLGGLSQPTLQFQTCYDLEPDHDYGYVETSTDQGLTWTSVATYTGRTAQWSRETVNLDLSGAETLQLRFRLDTDANGTADGWYIDNVDVFTVQEAPPVAAFTTSSPDFLGQMTTFSNASTGGNLTFEWDLGDGSPVETAVHLTHTYAITGTFTVVLTATNSLGSDTVSEQVVIENPLPPPPALRGHWTLDEASGQRQDSSTYANHLTDHNTVGSTTGQIGLAADLESDNNEYLSISHADQNGLDITASLSLVGWFNPERLDLYQVMAAKYEYGVNNRAYRFDLRPGNILAFVASPDGTLSTAHLLEANPPFSLTQGTWYHVAAVFDAEGRTLSLYLDGDLIGSRSVTYDTIYHSSAPFMFGACLNNGQVTRNFDGQLDEWYVFAQALSEGEIENLMAAPAPTPTPTATSTSTQSPVPTPTETPTPTATSTPIQSPTPTLTEIPTPTATSTPTATPSPPSLSVYPYPGETTTTSVVISWATDNAGAGEVRYSLDQSYNNIVAAVSNIYDGKHWHSATIAGLTADTTYYYKVYTGGDDVTPWPEVTFTTAPEAAAPRFTFITLGDSRPDGASSPPSQGALDVAAEIGQHSFDLALHTGDIVNSGGICPGDDSSWNQYIRAYFDLYRENMGDIPFYPSVGNHELNGGSCGYQGYTDVYYLPGNGLSGDEEEYYSFDWGNTHFVALDTNQDYSAGSTQYNWLVNDLQASTQPWKFVFFHHPPYSSGSHGSTSEVQTHLVPIFETYGVDVVFSGHDHHYERTCPLLNDACTTPQDGGVVYYVTGGGGAPLYPVSGDWFTAYSDSLNHFLNVEVNDCRLRLDAIDTNGHIFDSYEIDHCVSPTSTPTPTETATPTPAETLTPTPTETATPTEELTPTETATPTPAETLTPTPTETATPTPADTLTPTPTETATPTEEPTPTETATPTPADTLTPTPTDEPTATDTPTPTETAT